jgi:hypothetical protein
LTSSEIQSSAVIEASRDGLCGIGSGGANADDLFGSLEDRAKVLSSNGLEAIARSERLSDQADGESVATAHLELQCALETAGTPEAFRALATEMERTAASHDFEWQPSEFSGAVPSAFVERHEQYEWRLSAVNLAYCQLAPLACQPGRAEVLIRCAPLNCRAGESLPAYIQRTMPQEHFVAAQQYAQALLAMRKPPGG